VIVWSAIILFYFKDFQPFFDVFICLICIKDSYDAKDGKKLKNNKKTFDIYSKKWS